MGFGEFVYSLRCLDVSDTVQLHRRRDPHLQVSSTFAKQYTLLSMQKTGANANISSCLDTPITQNIKKQMTSELSNPQTPM